VGFRHGISGFLLSKLYGIGISGWVVRNGVQGIVQLM
jgi:hypothetical protein